MSTGPRSTRPPCGKTYSGGIGPFAPDGPAQHEGCLIACTSLIIIQLGIQLGADSARRGERALGGCWCREPRAPVFLTPEHLNK